MKDLERIKEALKALRQIDGVEGCYVEEEGDVLHVYTITRTADYDLQERIFKEYDELEERFPHVSFEFRTTSQTSFTTAGKVF